MPCCRKLADGVQFQKEFSHWACRIHLAQYAHLLVYGTSAEQQEKVEDLQNEDVNLYNKREIQAVLGIKSPAGQVQTIKKLLQSITVPARTERLCQFIENSVRNLHFLDTSDGERQALTALCNSFAQDVKQGSVDRSRLELAAKVAAGGPNVWVA